jgi:D-sedoheptulose 7-phosphate isomerase
MLEQSAAAIVACQALVDQIALSAQRIAAAFAAGHQVLICGNGGSAAQAQHFAGELLGRFMATAHDRPPRAVIALSADSAVLTGIGNDYGYDDVFARQVRGLARAGDVLVGISTSGSSVNILRAFEVAEPDVLKIALCGPQGRLAELADVALCVPYPGTPAIQAAHLAILHAMCLVMETSFAVSV